MKNILRLAIKNMFNRRSSFILLTIQLTAVLVMITLFIAMTDNILVLKSIARSSGIDNYVFFFPKDQYFDVKVRDRIYKVILDQSEIESINRIISVSSKKPTDNKFIKTYIGNADFIKNIRLPVSDGIWFDKYKTDNDIYPVIVSNDLKGKFGLNKKYDLLVSDGYKSFDIKVIVIGILKEPNYMITFSGSSIDGMISRTNDSILLLDDNIIDKLFTVQNNLALGPSEDFDFSDKAMQYLNDSLSGYGEVRTVQNMVDLYNDIQKDGLFLLASLGIIILAVTLSGIGGSNYLSTITNEKTFALYFMHGATWKDCILINLIKNILSMIIPLFASIAVIYALGMTALKDYADIGLSDMLIPFAFCLVIFFATSLIPILRFYKTDPAAILRKRL